MNKYGLKLLTPPAEEPVTVADILAHLRIAQGDSEAGVLTGLQLAARGYVETATARQLVTATWLLSLDAFLIGPAEFYYHNTRYGEIRFPLAPLQSVTSVVYTDSLGATQTFSPSLYQVDNIQEPGRIRPAFTQVWPVTQPLTFNAVQITYVAGFGGASSVPQQYKLAILMLVGHLYEHREASTEVSLSMIPLGLAEFINSLKYREYV